MKKFNKNRKAFSLVELVIVILIIAVLAVAVFAGGSKTIRKSQVSRTVSDLHNFSIAVETVLNENPNVANITKQKMSASDTTAIADIKDKLNTLLAADYQLKAFVTDLSGNIKATKTTATDDVTYIIYESAKTDSWGNPYYVIFDTVDRTAGGAETEFYITVVSAGPNAKTDLDNAGSGKGAIDSDDIFLLAEYKNGDVSSMTYDYSNTATNPTLGSAVYVGATAHKVF